MGGGKGEGDYANSFNSFAISDRHRYFVILTHSENKNLALTFALYILSKVLCFIVLTCKGTF